MTNDEWFAFLSPIIAEKEEERERHVPMEYLKIDVKFSVVILLRYEFTLTKMPLSALSRSILCQNIDVECRLLLRSSEEYLFIFYLIFLSEVAFQ